MYRYVTSTLTVCALSGMISVFAQQQTPTESQREPQAPTPAQSEQQTPAPSGSEEEKTAPAPEAATLTGCVQEAKTTDGGTVYVLSKAEGGNAAMYVLAGPPPSEFATHVKHKVEVIGQVQQRSPAQNEAAKDPKVLRPPSVQVQSVKVVAESC
jgi:hypothetical protein